MFFPICEDKHWHVHVVNIAATRVDILSFIPLKRQNKISVASRRLSSSISRAMHGYGLYMDFDISKFEHVQPKIVQKSNGLETIIILNNIPFNFI